jgi:hypothetical protein
VLDIKVRSVRYAIPQTLKGFVKNDKPVSQENHALPHI